MYEYECFGGEDMGVQMLKSYSRITAWVLVITFSLNASPQGAK